MHSGTPWVNPTPSKTPPIRTGISHSSFTSDRLPPKPQQQKQKGSGNNNNNNKQAKDVPKSLEVKRLESILSGLRSLRVDGPLEEKGPDPKGGCFCQGECNRNLPHPLPIQFRARGIQFFERGGWGGVAKFIRFFCRMPHFRTGGVFRPINRAYISQTGRIHPLSTYTPVCHTCGLPLCSLNLPYHPCPHPPCRTSLLSSTPDPFRAQIQPLVARIETEIRDQLKKEENERVLAAEELRIREGAFPILRPSPSPTPSPSPGNHLQDRGYAVMSLSGGRGGKRSHVTLASYRPGNISKSSSSSSLKKEAEVDDLVRIRCPPSQVEPIKIV